LEIDEERTFAAVGVSEFTGEHVDAFPSRVMVIQRNLERMLDRDQPGQQHFVRHQRDSPAAWREA